MQYQHEKIAILIPASLSVAALQSGKKLYTFKPQTYSISRDMLSLLKVYRFSFMPEL